jgi:hypothetical protein
MDEEHEYHEDDAPLSEDERDALSQDLMDVDMLKDLLGPRGIKGAVFYCPDCDEDHFLTWELLSGNLQELLEQGESPVHEPAFDPDPDEYVSWDYARGFLDGYESFEDEELSEVTQRLVNGLLSKGWGIDQIKTLLATAGLQANSSGKKAEGKS